jgi:hypothetical protein
VQFYTITVLIFGRNRENRRRTACDPGCADHFKVVPRRKLLGIENMCGGFGRAGDTRDQSPADALSQTPDSNDLLCRTVKLQQTLVDLAIANAMPDPMSRKAAVAFVNEGSLVTLLLVRLRETPQRILRFISMYREDKPSTKQ